ncbi:MAG: flagellar biosynthetic protein FliO [Enterobacterales bacterium]|nr:flagellar biosynthetic protein FliO [Enterobacterales bacterium]
MKVLLNLSTLVKYSLLILTAFNVKAAVATEKLDSFTPSDSILPMFFGLLVILLVIFVLAFIFRKFTNFSSTSGKIKILESQMIGSKEKLLVVEVGSQQFFLGVTNQNITSLGEIEQKNKFGQEEHSKQPGFSNLFSQILSGKVIQLNQASKHSKSSKSDSNAN